MLNNTNITENNKLVFASVKFVSCENKKTYAPSLSPQPFGVIGIKTITLARQTAKKRKSC